VVRAVVAAASITAVVVAAIVPALAAVVIKAIVPAFPAIVIKAIVPYAVAHLLLALLMVGRIIAAALCLGNGRYRDGSGDGERRQDFGVAGVHLWIPLWGCHCEAPRCR
jgi:hypothetical protein